MITRTKISVYPGITAWEKLLAFVPRSDINFDRNSTEMVFSNGNQIIRGSRHLLWKDFYRFRTGITVIPHVITDKKIYVVIKSEGVIIESSHPNFETIATFLRHGNRDEAALEALLPAAPPDLSGYEDHLCIVDGKLLRDGAPLPSGWLGLIHHQPVVRALLIAQAGDQVTVKGDPDAPDGVYTIDGIDLSDPGQCVYVETDAYFGYLATPAIQEVTHVAR